MASKPPAPPPAPSEKTVVLTAPHEHAGREYPAGATLTLPTDAADWLIGLGRAQPAD